MARSKQCPTGMQAQSIIFPIANGWTKRRARAWLLSHGHKAPRCDETADYLRYRQADPDGFKKGSFRTIEFGDSGIKAIVACPIGRANPRPARRAYQRVKAARDAISIDCPVTVLGVLIEMETNFSKTDVKRRSASKYFHYPFLCVSADKKTLYVLPNVMVKVKPSTVAEVALTAAQRIKRLWSGFEANEVIPISIRSRVLRKAGTINSITYRSDKWTGRQTNYRHDFDRPAICWAGSGGTYALRRPDQKAIISSRGVIG